ANAWSSRRTHPEEVSIPLDGGAASIGSENLDDVVVRTEQGGRNLDARELSRWQPGGTGSWPLPDFAAPDRADNRSSLSQGPLATLTLSQQQPDDVGPWCDGQGGCLVSAADEDRRD